MKKTILALILCICTILPTFASCSVDLFKKPDDSSATSETDTERETEKETEKETKSETEVDTEIETEADTETETENESDDITDTENSDGDNTEEGDSVEDYIPDGPYYFEFRDVGNGQCVITNIVFREGYSEPLDVEVPCTSYNGKEVVGIRFSSDIVLRIIRDEEFEEICRTLENNIEMAISEGRVSNPENERLRFDRFKSWYTSFSLEEAATQDMYDRWLQDYPVLAVTDTIYVLDDTIGTRDRIKQNDFLLEYGITLEDILEANQNLCDEIENSTVQNKNGLLESSIVGKIVQYPETVQKLVFNNLKYYFGYYGSISNNEINVVVSLDESVTSIGDSAFYGCSSLTSINIPESVTSIDNSTFYGCSSLTSITIPNSITNIGDYAFRFCSSLTSINIPNRVTSIGFDAFYNCNNLTRLDITDIAAWCKIEFINVKSNPLYYANNLYLKGTLVTELIIPDGVASIGNSVFVGCSSLTSINIPGSVTSIGDSVFYGCSSLTSINIPDGVMCIGHSAFDGCNSLIYNEYDNAYYLGNNNNPYVVLIKAKTTDVTICEIYEKAKLVYNNAFNDCNNLVSIIIPDSVTSIGNSAFRGCDSFTSVYYNGSVEAWNGITIGSNNSKLKSAARYYYSETEPEDDGNNYWRLVNGMLTPW